MSPHPSQDGTTSYSVGADGKLRQWNVTQAATSVTVIGQHDAPIRCVKHYAASNLVITGSWDKSIRLWDCRSPNPVASATFNDKVTGLDVKAPALVVLTADKLVHVFDLTAGLNKIAEYKSPIDKFQNRCVASFADGKGFAIGSIEGRVAVEPYSELPKKSLPPPTTKDPNSPNFIFKCHRDKRPDNGFNIYCVNSISFHPGNTLCTGGSDGTVTFWDKDVRCRLGALEKFKNKCPVTSVVYAPKGNVLFYAMSYDWSRGAEHNNSSVSSAGWMDGCVYDE